MGKKELILRDQEQMEQLAKYFQSETLEHGFRTLDEALGLAERAYVAYLEAQRLVANAYRANEQRIAQAYQKAERQAQNAYNESVRQALKARDEAVTQALKARDEAITQAEKAYRKATEEAEKACEASIEVAWRKREETIEQALQLQKQTMEQTWNIYTKAHLDKIFRGQEAVESLDSILSLSDSADPVLAELWDNERDTVYDTL